MTEKKKFADLNPEQRINYFDAILKKHVFSMKLIQLYLQELKRPENIMKSDIVELLEAGVADRLNILGKDSVAAVEYITKK